MTEAQIQEIVDKRIYDLLHPTVEIVSLDNPLPTFATPGDAAVDVMASVKRVKTELMQHAYLLTREMEIHEQLDDAMQQEDREIVNQLWDMLDSLSEEQKNEVVAIVIKPGGHCLVPTGLFTSFPADYVEDVMPRSGLALKKRITMTNSPGKIDSGFRSEIGLILDNEGNEDFVIHQGDRIAQMQFSIKCTPNFVRKSDPSELSGPDRGGGFGHTGMKP